MPYRTLFSLCSPISSSIPRHGPRTEPAPETRTQELRIEPVAKANLQKNNTNKFSCWILGFSICNVTLGKPFARVCFAQIFALIFARIFCTDFLTDFCTDFLHGFFARIFCTDFLHGFSAQIFCTVFCPIFLRGFLRGLFARIVCTDVARIFARIFSGCPKTLAGKRQNFTEKIPWKIHHALGAFWGGAREAGG